MTSRPYGARGGHQAAEKAEGRCWAAAIDWSAALEAIQDPIFIHDADHRIITANPAYCQRAGMSLEAIRGRPYWEVFPRRRGPLPRCGQVLRERLAGRRLPEDEAEAVEEFEIDGGETFVSRSFGVNGAAGEYRYSVHILEDVTEQRRAEHQRSLAEAKVQALAGAAQDGMVMTDEQDRVVFCNPAAEALFGLAAEQLNGRLFDEALLPERCLRRMGAGQGSGDIEEARARHSDGRLVPVEISTAALTLEGRRYQVRVLRDISERKAAAQALRERENQLDYLLANTTEGILVVDPQGTIVYANATAGELFNRSPGDLLGGSFGFPVTATHPQEIELRTPEKETRTVEMRVREVHWEGATARLLNLHDITERKRVEMELRRAAIVFEEAHEGILITGADAQIVAVNRAFTEITGYSEAEILGHNPRVLSSGYHDASFYAAMWEAIEQRGYWSGEIWNRRRDGTAFAALVTIREVRDEAGYRTHFLAVFSDISRVKEYQQQLERMMHMDPLTGLPNRLLFHDRLDQALVSSQRGGRPLAVLSLDINDFGTINDSLGHSVGDQILELLGERLQGAIDEEDTVARLGGDEFGVLAPQLQNLEDAVTLAERILAGTDAPFVVEGQEIPVTTRIGLSVYPDQASTGAELIQQADTAMYQAKREGITYRFFSEELTEQARERVQLAAELRQALAQGQIVAHYQPQVDLASGRWLGLEALARWHHPEHGWISPGRFIPVAERTGLIVRLGESVLEQACAQARAWLEDGYALERMAVNIAAPQLGEADFVERVCATLERTGLGAEHLELEITESLLVDPDEGAVSKLQRLREIGITVAIDDFGTGYSALSYLKDLPVDRLKIDRSFVDGLPDDPHVSAISRAITALGNSLGFVVIAEGIETEAQHAALLEEGCDQGQGFLFGRPLAPEATARLWPPPR